MNFIWQKFKNLDNILFLFILAFVFNIITFFILYYKIHPGNGTLALRYNVLTGVDLYGRGTNLYLIPGVGFILFLLNLFLFSRIKNTKTFLSFLTAFTSITVEIILLFAVIFLTKVN